MKLFLVGLVTSFGLLATAACESTSQYDGVSRFANSGYYGAAYHGPGSPPRDSGGAG
jgi:hypothetical protein